MLPIFIVFIKGIQYYLQVSLVSQEIRITGINE
jgi:hypothetical protein